MERVCRISEKNTDFGSRGENDGGGGSFGFNFDFGGGDDGFGFNFNFGGGGDCGN